MTTPTFSPEQIRHLRSLGWEPTGSIGESGTRVTSVKRAPTPAPAPKKAAPSPAPAKSTAPARKAPSAAPKAPAAGSAEKATPGLDPVARAALDARMGLVTFGVVSRGREQLFGAPLTPEERERAELLATRPDLSPEDRRALESAPLEKVREIVKSLPRQEEPTVVVRGREQLFGVPVRKGA